MRTRGWLFLPCQARLKWGYMWVGPKAATSVRYQRWKWNIRLTWLRISGLSGPLWIQIIGFPKRKAFIPRCNLKCRVHSLQNPSSSHTSTSYPSSVSVHARAIPFVLKLVYLDFVCIYILGGAVHCRWCFVLHQSPPTSSAMEGSRWPPVRLPLLNSPFCVTSATFSQQMLQFR